MSPFRIDRITRPHARGGATRAPIPIAVALLLLVGVGWSPAAGQNRAPEPLPDEVRAWLERDQIQRWRMMVAEGDSIFNNRSCRRCHGDGGTGTARAPDLTDGVWTQSDGSLQGIRETIFWGVRRQFFSDPDYPLEMNPGGGVDLTWAQYDALAAYVWTLSNGGGGG